MSKDWIISERMPYVSGMKNEWIQEDGETLLILQMDDEHLENAIKKVEKDIEMFGNEISRDDLKKTSEKLEELKAEYKSRI